MTYKLVYDDEPSQAQDAGVIDMPKHDDKEAQAALWDAVVTGGGESEESAPITREEVSGKPPDSEPEALPDRALVSKDLSEFLKSRKPEIVNPVIEQATRIEAALEQIQTPEPVQLSFEETLLQKIESLEQRGLERDQREADREAQAEYEQQISDFRSRITTSIEDRKEDFPAIVALGRTQMIADHLFTALDNDEEVSEVDIASKMEEALWAEYNKMKALETNSKDKPKPSTKPTPTSDVVSKAVNDEFELHTSQNKKDQQEALWARIVNAGG